MYLYKKSEWILMSCVLNQDRTGISKYKLKWDNYKDQWENDWYPKITQFLGNVKWHDLDNRLLT